MTQPWNQQLTVLGGVMISIVVVYFVKQIYNIINIYVKGIKKGIIVK